MNNIVILCRFNPLFEEEIKKRNDTTKDVTDNETGDHDTISTTSSGYGSNSTQKGDYHKSMTLYFSRTLFESVFKESPLYL